MSRYADRPYGVGKGKPPVESRWKKGQSGNPRGAPRKAKRRTKVLRDLLIELLNEEVSVAIGPKSVRLSKKDALLIKMVHDALEGTPAHRLKAFRALCETGAFDVSPEDMRRPEAERRKFLEQLAEMARSKGA